MSTPARRDGYAIWRSTRKGPDAEVFWDTVKARANTFTTPPPCGTMPEWVKNKRPCRWAWDHLPAWRAVVATSVLPAYRRRELNRLARVAYARRDSEDKPDDRDQSVSR